MAMFCPHNPEKECDECGRCAQPTPTCPICNKKCDTYFKDINGEIVGCENCVIEIDSY